MNKEATKIKGSVYTVDKEKEEKYNYYNRKAKLKMEENIVYKKHKCLRYNIRTWVKVKNSELKWKDV